MPEEPTTIECKYKFLQYGMFEFKGYVKTSLNGQLIYSEDGITAKYNRYTLEAEFILTKELVALVDSQFNPEFPGSADIDPATVDVAMDKIRFQLQRPHCRLTFWHHGAGIILNVLGQSEDEETEDSDYKYKNHLWFNLMEGPFPEIIAWEPLGLNNAIRCRWRCTFNLPVNEVIQNAAWVTDSRVKGEARAKAGLQPIQDLVNNYMSNYIYKDPALGDIDATGIMGNYVLSVTEEHEFEVSDEGTVVSTLSGVIEFTGSGAMFLNNNGDPSAIPRLIQLMTHYFEPLHPVGFTRTQKYKLRKSKRELEYVITDKELQSDNPLLPNIVKADVTHSVSSDLLSEDSLSGSGFLTWASVFEGTITVAPGKWKGWAWIAMMCIVQQRLLRTNAISPGKIKDAESASNTAANMAEKNNFVNGNNLLTKISIKESIYTRQVSFSISYLLISNLYSLFVNSGLFEPVHISWQGFGDFANPNPNVANMLLGAVPTDIFTTDGSGSLVSTRLPNSYEQQWNQSRESMSNTQNVYGYRGPLMPGYNVIFNPYTEEDPNRLNLASVTKHKVTPEKAYWPDSEVSGTDFVDVGAKNIHELAQHRRNTHLETFGNLDFQYGNTPGAANLVHEGANPLGKPRNNNSTANNNPPAFPNSYDEDVDKYAGFDAQNFPVTYKSRPENTWVSYDVRFEIVRNENTIHLPTIQPQQSSTRMTTSPRKPTTLRGHTGFSVLGGSGMLPPGSGGSTTEQDYAKHAFVSFGLPTVKIRCVGSATRMLFPIPTPDIVGIQNIQDGTNSANSSSTGLVQAYRVGTSVWRHGMVNKSADLPMFGAEWDILYALRGDVLCDNIGIRSVQPSEFS